MEEGGKQTVQWPTLVDGLWLKHALGIIGIHLETAGGRVQGESPLPQHPPLLYLEIEQEKP